MNTIRFTGIQVKEGKAAPIDDTVVKEERFSLFLNGRHFTDLVASANQLEELGAGFIISQGLSTELNDVEVSGSEIRVQAPLSGAIETEIETTGSIGVIRPPLGKVGSDDSIAIDEVRDNLRDRDRSLATDRRGPLLGSLP